jgi:hypothetical protein
MRTLFHQVKSKLCGIAFKQLIPEAFTEGRVDFARLQAALGEFVDDSPERYSFSWAGKRDAIRLLQIPTRADSERSWTVTREDIEAKGYDLKAVNPNAKMDVDTRTPAEILDIIEAKGREVAEALAALRKIG